jgi:perosamine synthetase
MAPNPFESGGTTSKKGYYFITRRGYWSRDIRICDIQTECADMKKIPLIKPYITQEIKDKVCEVLDSGFLTEGSVTREFEETVKEYLGCEYALAVTSCTTGLEVALRALGIGSGDEVIIPDFTYPATADVVNIVGAKIVIVDVLKETMLIDYDALEDSITDQTKAIIPVSLFGNPLDYDRLRAIKKKYGIYIVEDAACALGAEFKGIKVGNLADITVFSFHPRKFITTGEGGVITTNNPKWADWMNSYKHFGMGGYESRLTMTFDRIGTNYKMSNLLAAVGLCQIQEIEKLLARRIELADNYLALLDNNGRVGIPKTTDRGKHSQQSFCIYINNRNEVMHQMREIGIEVQIGSYSLHMHPPFAPSEYCRVVGDLVGSKYAFDHCLVLPLYHELTLEEQRVIVHEISKRI